jgi:uncharacterized phage-associated protein
VLNFTTNPNNCSIFEREIAAVVHRIDDRKYAEAILFFVTECDNATLGAVKLLKLLYFMDFDHYERFERAITWDVYRKHKHGPVGSAVYHQIDALVARGDLVHRTPQENNGRHRFEARRKYNLSIFDPDEVNTLWDLVKIYKHVPTDEIRRDSHLDLPWVSAAKYGDVIPYEAVFERQRLIQEAAEDKLLPKTPPAQSDSAAKHSNARFSRALSQEEKEALFQFIVGNEELEGVEMDPKRARRIFEEALKAPLLER